MQKSTERLRDTERERERERKRKRTFPTTESRNSERVKPDPQH